MSSRCFTKAQKKALLVQANGMCEACSIPITINNMHADHIIPYSMGGPTTVLNGAALCKRCNLEKGASMKFPKLVNKRGERVSYREWQKDCLGKAQTRMIDGGKSWFANVCPGGGKTIYGVAFAKWALGQQFIDKVIVVSPRKKIRDQWEDMMQLNGIPTGKLTQRQAVQRRDAMPKMAISITYQMACTAEVVEHLRLVCAKYRVLVIGDEIHWTGVQGAAGTSWGRGFAGATEHAKFVLPMSGTPFREDFYQLPFLQYEDGRGTPDYDFSYGEALLMQDVTPIYFGEQTGAINFRRLNSETRQLINEELLDFADGVYLTPMGEVDEAKMQRRLTASLQNNSRFWRDMFDNANEQLQRLRRTGHPSAGGIIFARDQDHARAIAGYISESTGENPAVIISDEDKDIDGFAQSTRSWVVSVRMINEGVDIERLRVAVMMTNVTTRKNFMQSVARCIRLDNENLPNVRAVEQWAYVYMPADPRFVEWAIKFKDAVSDQEMEPPGEGGTGPVPPPTIYDVDDGDSDAGGVVFNSEYFTREELEDSIRDVELSEEDREVLFGAFPDEAIAMIAMKVAEKQRKEHT